MTIHTHFHALRVGALAALTLMTCTAMAAVSADEAAKLKSTLTPLGGEKAGSADGTIPAWDGGYTKLPAGWKSGEPRPDPFAGEKPLYSITAQNMAQYASKLSEGQQALLKKYPSYRIDVYKTHRTAAAPKFVYDNTYANATRAKTSADGYSIEGAYGGIPFPIPKTGAEVMWNHQLRWLGESVEYLAGSYTVSGDKPVLAGASENKMSYPYYFSDGSLENFDGDYWHFLQLQTAPSYKAGETILIRDSVDFAGKGRQAWQYLTGQRRVRKAPNIAYDTPNATTSGIILFDEVSLFIGALDKYDWKLVGKKEMIVPYNVNAFWLGKVADVLQPQFLNPDALRWEVHRVWEIEATLGAGKRHVVPKKKFYVDEDTWTALLYDGWDAQGQLWRSGLGLPFVAYEYPGTIANPFTIYDLLKSSYSATILNEQRVQYRKAERWPASTFTPESMAAQGVR